MSKVSQISLKSIIKQIDIKFKLQDINKFCSDPKVAQGLQKRLNNSREFQEYLIQSEAYIDKEKLLLISWLNYKEDLIEKLSGSKASEDDYREVEKNLIEIKKLLKETEKKKREVLSSAIMSQSSKQKELIGLASDEKELRKFEETLQNMLKIKELSSDMDTYIVTIFSTNGILNKIDIISSKEEMLQANFSNKGKENKRICDEIDEKLSAEGKENIGLNYALQCIEQEDLRYVLPQDIANAAIYKIENNTSIMYEKEIERLKNEELEDEDKVKLEEKIREEGIIPQIREAIQDVFKYIDLKKLLLIAIYRFEDAIENNRYR